MLLWSSYFARYSPRPVPFINSFTVLFGYRDTKLMKDMMVAEVRERFFEGVAYPRITKARWEQNMFTTRSKV